MSVCVFAIESGSSLRRLDVPSTQVKLGDLDKSFYWILNLGQGEQVLGVRHEAVGLAMSLLFVPFQLHPQLTLLSSPAWSGVRG